MQVSSGFVLIQKDSCCNYFCQFFAVERVWVFPKRAAWLGWHDDGGYCWYMRIDLRNNKLILAAMLSLGIGAGVFTPANGAELVQEPMKDGVQNTLDGIMAQQLTAH